MYLGQNNMKLYLLSQDVNNGYDTYSDCIVCANDEKDAISISPDDDHCPIDLGEANYNWTIQSNVKCEYIGEAKEGLKRGVVCASYHAG